MSRRNILRSEPIDTSKLEARIWIKHLLSSRAAFEDYAADLRDQIALYIHDKDKALADGKTDIAQMALAKQRSVQFQLNTIEAVMDELT